MRPKYTFIVLARFMWVALIPPPVACMNICQSKDNEATKRFNTSQAKWSSTRTRNIYEICSSWASNNNWRVSSGVEQNILPSTKLLYTVQYFFLYFSNRIQSMVKDGHKSALKKLGSGTANSWLDDCHGLITSGPHNIKYKCRCSKFGSQPIKRRGTSTTTTINGLMCMRIAKKSYDYAHVYGQS